MTAADFPWPLVDGRVRPIWTGRGFRVGDRDVPVLEYSGGASGWSEGLTDMHEASAGTDHPIDRMSRAWALGAARRYVPSGSPAVLEIGSSSGFLLDDLQAAFPQAVLIGSDFLNGPLQRVAARVPGVPLLQFDLVQCPLPDASVDVAILLNVLEHIEDDRAAARQIARVLKPGGVAIVELPAGPHLFDVYDEYLRHHRRYSAAGVRSLLTGAGLEVCDQSHLGFLVYPSFVIVKRRNQKRDLSDPEVKHRVVEANITSTRASRLLRACLQVEAWFGRYLSYPVGIRVVTVARKPAGGR